MNCIIDGCTFEAATDKTPYCADHGCAYKNCTEARAKDIYCTNHAWHMGMIEYHEGRIKSGMIKYGLHGGILRDQETLELLPEPKEVVIRTPKAPKVAEEVAVSASPQVDVAAPIAVEPASVEATAVVVNEPVPIPSRPPSIKPKVVRAKREPPLPAPTLPRCRTSNCHLAVKELGLCPGCLAVFLPWRRYTNAGLVSPIMPSAEQAEVFTLINTELKLRTGT